MQLNPAPNQRDFSAGMITDANISVMPQSSCSLIVNMDADRELGSLVSRLGSAQISLPLVANKTVLGIVQHVDQADTTKNKLFASINDSSNTNADIFDVGTGISLADDTASLKVYFLNYNGDTLRLNGTDAPKAYNSTNWITTGGVFDLANMPTGYKYPKEFLSRVYLYGKASAPYTLAYSGVLTAGAVSWTSGNGTIEIEPEDNGGEATGLGKVPGYLMIYNRRSLHRWNFSSAFPDQLINIGAYSQESIVEAHGLNAFYSDSNENAKGFYITDGNRPKPISHDNNRPIRKWVQAISSSATVAGFGTPRGFKWSVGDLTVDGETYNNVWLCYNLFLNQWTIYTTPTQFSCFANYVASGVHAIVGGDDDGNVIRVDKPDTHTDAPSTTAIPWKVRQQHWTYGDNRIKTVENELLVRGKNIDGAAFRFIVNEDLTKPIDVPQKEIEPFWKRVFSLFEIGERVRGATIAAEIAGSTSGAHAHLREIEIPKVDIVENNTE